MIKFLFIVSFIALVSCVDQTPSTQSIVNQAIKTSGTEVLQNAEANFSFRGNQYTYSRSNGNFEYGRALTDTLGNEIKDVLTNDGLIRFINKEEADITAEKKEAYSSSVNSVIYFAFLPIWLNDNAVNKFYEGISEINQKKYYKIKVTFNPEGGGEDFEDVFYYWFDTSDYSMDYLAYSYNEKDGKGMRFRVAYNPRKINGVIIQDYKNLKPKIKDSIPLSDIDQAYIRGDLEQLSLIELEDVVISMK